jgi:hypothetical protein
MKYVVAPEGWLGTACALDSEHGAARGSQTCPQLLFRSNAVP